MLVTLEGMVTETSDVQPLNAYSEIDVVPELIVTLAAPVQLDPVGTTLGEAVGMTLGACVGGHPVKGHPLKAPAP